MLFDGHFDQIWVADFEYQCLDGGFPKVHCMVARELTSGKIIRLFEDELLVIKQAPFGTGSRSLFIAFYAPAEFSCFLELGWEFPSNTVDLYAEYRLLRCGMEGEKAFSLVAALRHFNLDRFIPEEKHQWRELAIRGGPYSKEERKGLLDYCQEDVDATCSLAETMLNGISLPHALIRGRYMQSIALMERNGVPMDYKLLNEVISNWTSLKRGLIEKIDTQRIYRQGSFSEQRFEQYLRKVGIPWPRLDSGRLELTDEVFRQKSKTHPKAIAPYHELRTSLSRLKLAGLSIGPDGRNRAMLSPFRSDTGRNQPSTSKFIFGPSCWIRGFIKPGPGRFIAYIDYSQQELGIAAALSEDERMKEAYRSGDPYLRFAQMAGAVPENATKQSHPEERSAYKVCMLAVQYGMGAESLAIQLGKTRHDANKLLRAHKDTFPTYWGWNDRILNQGFGNGSLETIFRWRRAVQADAKPASVGNFPVQGNGAEMLRLAIIKMHERDIQVAAPIHDAVLIEGSIEQADTTVQLAQSCMREASKMVLSGFELDSEAEVVAFPNRYMDKERGRGFWNTVMELTDRKDCQYEL